MRKVEVPARHLARTVNENPQRPKYPTVEQPHEQGKDQRRGHAGHPGAHDQRAILHSHFRGETAQLGLQVAGQLAGQNLQVVQLALQAAHPVVVENPTAVALDGVDLLQGGFDLADRFAPG